MMRLLLRNSAVTEKSLQEMTNANCEAMIQRGVSYAPRVEAECFGTKELVDRELVEAIKRSVSVECLMKEDVAFCSWF